MTAPPNRTLAWALELARAGILVFPCKRHDRAPFTEHGFKDATTNETQIRTWFGRNPNLNLAIRCGPQSCKLNLVVLDIDAQSGGLGTWAAWEAAHTVPVTVRHETPSGGFHLFFNAPEEFRPSASQFGAGIDVRASDSYVVAPPSVAPSKITGELSTYQGHQELFLGDEGSVAAMPADIRAQLVAISSNGDRGVVVPLRRDHPSQFDLSDSVADLARVGWDWFTELERDGWTLDRVRGSNSDWVRPGKDARHGSSAELHNGNEGPLVTFSTSLPVGGKPARGAAIGSFSPWDYIKTFRAGGDNREAARLVRGVAPAPRRTALAPTPDFDDTPGDNESPGRLPTLPAEFWDHPINAHILAAARARRCGPDALALNVLLRASMMVPPSFLLPPLSGGFSPINLLGCVVGRTGEGKSVSIAAAADVLAMELPWLLWDMPLGSGEGVGDVFMLDETEEGARGKKKTGRRVQNPDLKAVHFVVDEGAALVETSSRKGATIIPALCKAWTGVTLGETNVAVNSRRVRALSYRVSAVVNIQPVNFHRLFNTANTGTGLTGRFLFAPAADYDMPDERGDWPGPLEFPALHGSSFGNELTYEQAIYAEVDAAIVRANRTGGTPENVSHANLLRARVAAIYALWDDRRVITVPDWRTAGLLIETSAAVLGGLDNLAVQAERDLRHKQDDAKALSVIHQNTIIEQGDIAKFKGRIIERCGHGGMTRRQIKDLKDSPRDVLWAALDALLVEGLIVKDGSVFKRAR